MAHRAFLLGLTLLAAIVPACKGCKACAPDSEEEEKEEKDQALDNFWRAQITIVGKGTVRTSGYSDTGGLETVTAVFVVLPPGGEVP